MLECRFCSKSFPAYDEDEFRRDGVITLSFSSVPYEHFGGRSKCSRNVLGTVEEKYHATRGGETCYWREGLGEWLTYDTDQGDTLWDGTPCVCGSSSRKAPGCATRTVKVKGPHEPAPFWTMELHCRVPSVLSAPARKFVLFTMFMGEAMDRDDGGGRARKAAAFSRDDVLEALPPDVWLHILSFLRVGELQFAGPTAHSHDEDVSTESNGARVVQAIKYLARPVVPSFHQLFNRRSWNGLAVYQILPCLLAFSSVTKTDQISWGRWIVVVIVFPLVFLFFLYLSLLLLLLFLLLLQNPACALLATLLILMNE